MTGGIISGVWPGIGDFKENNFCLHLDGQASIPVLVKGLAHKTELYSK